LELAGGWISLLLIRQADLPLGRPGESSWRASWKPLPHGDGGIAAFCGGGAGARKKHLRGVSAKEQREYEHIKESAQRSGRYGSRAKEVAARTVLKKHKAEGHRKGQ